ncbi:DUF3906 family protein [Bacillus tianshenii]|nr:DUF3906 family protein [Bacillus tianshenii]
MNLYRLQANTSEGELDIIAAAPDEETAFEVAEIEIEKHFLKLPVINDIVLYELKKIRNGNAFVLGKQE